MSTDKITTWEDKWAKGISWHLPDTNSHLLTNLEELVGPDSPKNGEVTTPKTILVPLCGKSKDMAYLYKQGHTVVGCEWVEDGCLQFFQENGIEYSRSVLEDIDGNVFQSQDGRLRIYQCDFLLLSSDVIPDLKFDAVWDVQSLDSINPRDRKQYVRALRSLLKDNFQYLLVTVEYEPFAHLGVPHSISYNAVKELFGTFCNIKFIAQLPASPPLKPAWRENVFSLCQGTEDRAIQYWQARWATGQSQWHSDKPHQYLVKYIDLLTNNGDKNTRILLPMCGKAGCVLWLYHQGYKVVGVEGVPFVVEQFFRENKLEHEKTKVKDIDGWKFQTKDGRLTMFACNFFTMTPEVMGPVDAVYDRGALEAIEPRDRKVYVKTMQNLLGSDFKYVLNAYEYDDVNFRGPPMCIYRDEVFELFDGSVSVLEEADYTEYGQAKYGLHSNMLKLVYSILPK